MKVKNYIQIFRFHFLKYILFGYIIYIGILGAILFALLIFLETIFYFSPATKLFVIYLLISLSIIFVMYWLVLFYMTKNEKVESYRINKFAFILGEKLFPNKKDSIIIKTYVYYKVLLNM